MKLGRNDPCPCGSGRKYKNCCLHATDVVADGELHWRRVRRAIEPLSRELVREAERHFGETGLEEAWSEFFDFDAPSTFDPRSRFVPIFFSWFLHDWRPDPNGTELPADVRDTTVAEAYLARAGRRLDPIARRYVEACIATPYSFHEVLQCNPGVGFRVRDVMLGSEAGVSERTASKTVEAGDCLFGKVVSVDGLALIEGVGPTAIPPVHKPELIELRKTLGTRGSLFGVETLREFADELRRLYLEIDGSLHRRPELRNTDGDPLEVHTLHFALDAPETALDRLGNLGGALDPPAVERDAAGELLHADITWLRRGDKTHAGADTVLGRLRIEGGRLTAEVNSAKRAAALRRLVERRLGDSAQALPSVVQSIQSQLDREGARSVQRAPDQRHAEARGDLSQAEIETAMRDMLRSHYQRWVDEKLPALGNRTPRKAVREPDGREAVEALVAQIERNGARMNPPLDPAIVGELRATLGLG